MKKNSVQKYVGRIVLLCITICMGINMMPSLMFAQITGSDFSNSNELSQDNTYQYEDMQGSKGPLSNGDIIDEKALKEIIGSYRLKIVAPEARKLKEGDFYYINLPERAIVTPTITSTEIKDGASATIATWDIVEVNGVHKIKIVFTSYVNAGNYNDDIECHFQLSFSLNLEKNPDGSNLKIDLPLNKDNNITIEIEPYIPPSTTPTQLVKEGVYDKDTHTILWTVSLKEPTQDWSGYTFTDSLDANLELLDIFRIDKDNLSTTLIKDSDYTYQNNFIEISSLDSQTKKLQIKTGVQSNVYQNNDATIIGNTAQIQDLIDPISPGILLQSNKKELTIKKDWLTKTGTVVDGNKIEWTLLVNKEQLNMKNAVVTDVLSPDLIFDSSTQISVKTGNTTTNLKADGTTTNEMRALLKDRELKIYLPSNINSNSYEIKFKTAVDPAKTDRKYKNEAILDVDIWGGKGDIYHTWKSPSIGQEIEVPSLGISKYGKLNKQNGIITWTIQAATNIKSYGKTSIIDTINSDDLNQSYTGRIKIYDINKNISQVYTLSLPSDTTPVSENIMFDSKSIAVTINGSPFTQNQTISFVYNDGIALKDTIKIEVDTQVKDRVFLGKAFAENNLTFKNHVSAKIDYTDGTTEEKTADATIKEQNELNKKENIKKTDYPKDLQNPYNNPRAYYKLTINPNNNHLENVIVQDNLNALITQFKKNGTNSEESLSSVSWSLVPNSIIIEQEKLDGYTKENLESLISLSNETYSTSSNILTFDFSKKPIESKYTIYFAVELAREIDGHTVKNNFINMNGIISLKDNISTLSHSLLNDEETINSKPTAKQEIGNNTLIIKTGAYNKENGQIDYRINVNQRKQYLGNPLTIEDYMSNAITLDPSSITLYKNVLDKEGNFIANLSTATKVSADSYNVDYQLIDNDINHPSATSKAIFAMPFTTSTAHDEAYVLLYSVDIKEGHFNETITNDALIPGISDTDKDSSSTHKVDVADTSGGSSTKRSSAQLHKVDQNGVPLPKATFSLYWISNTSETFINSLETDTNGEALFKGLKTSQTYMIKETKAPRGYAISNEEWFITPSAPGNTYRKDSNFVNLPLMSHPIKIQVDKTLFGKTWDTTRAFQITLAQSSTHALTENIHALSYDEMQTKRFTKANASQVFDDLKFPYISGDTYYYYKVEEEALSMGYKNETGTYYIRIKVSGEDTTNTLIATVDKVLCDKDGILSIIDSTSNFIQDTLYLTMKNSYTTPSVSFKISGKSNYDNTGAKDVAYLYPEFEYSLFKKGETIPIHTMKSNKDGSFAFSDLVYTLDDLGNHYYTIKVNPNLENILYAIQYDITITVIDNDDGTLSYTYKITQNGEEISSILFHHIYHESVIDVPEVKPQPPKKPGDLDPPNTSNTITGDTISLEIPCILLFASATLIVFSLMKKKRFE